MSYRLRKGLYVVWHYAKTIIKCWVTLFFFFNGSPPCTKSDCVMRWMLVFYFNTKSLFFIGSLASPPLIKEEKSNCFFFYKKRVFKKQKCKKRRKRKQNCKGKRKKMECVWEGGGYILGNYLVLRLTDFLLQSSSSIVSLIGLLIGEEGVARRGQ